MKNWDFEQANADFTHASGTVTRAFLGRLPGEPDNAPPRVVTRWRPVREEVEALWEGASAWLHLPGSSHMPAAAIGCYDPFQPVVNVGATSGGRVIDPENVMEVAESLSAMDTLRQAFRCEGQSPEHVLEKVLQYVHDTQKLLKTKIKG